jgi:general secretion pathway protein C
VLRNGLLILNTLAVVACGYLVASIVRTLISTAPASALELPKPPTVESPERSYGQYAAVGSRGLFRAGSEEAPPPAPVEEDLMESKLGVILHGTLASLDPDKSIAVVEDKSTRTKLYVRRGDALAGAKVMRVERKLIVLDNKGQLEKISFDEEDEKSGAKAKRGKGRNKGRKGRSRAARSSSRDAPVSMADRVRLLKEVSEQKPDQPNRRKSILTQARIVPRYGENGQLSGLQLSAIRPESLLEDAGFQNGDLVVTVNGTDLSDPSQGLKVFRELESAQSFAVDVERGGEILTVEYEAETQ